MHFLASNSEAHPKACPSRSMLHPRFNAATIPANRKRSTKLAHGRSTGNAKLRIGIRLVARTMAGAHIREAAAPRKVLLRVIKPPCWRFKIGAIIEYPPVIARAGATLLQLPSKQPHPIEATTLPQRGRLVRVLALLLMHCCNGRERAENQVEYAYRKGCPSDRFFCNRDLNKSRNQRLNNVQRGRGRMVSKNTERDKR